MSTLYTRRRLLGGMASDFIRPFRCRPGDRFVLCCRVSGYEQNRTEKLKRQIAHLRRIVESAGGIVVGIVQHVGSGTDAAWLARAVALAADNAVLLAETTDRLIRSPLYHSKRAPNEQARPCDLEELARWTVGCVVMTHLDPDAPPAAVRSYQRKRGQAASGNKGGRPAKLKPGATKRKQRIGRSKVAWMSAAGYSVREIAELTGEHKSAIQRWKKPR